MMGIVDLTIMHKSGSGLDQDGRSPFCVERMLEYTSVYNGGSCFIQCVMGAMAWTLWWWEYWTQPIFMKGVEVVGSTIVYKGGYM